MRIRGAFEAALAQAVRTRTFAKEVAKTLARSPAIFDPTATHVVKMADNKVIQALQPEISAVPPSPHPSASEG